MTEKWVVMDAKADPGHKMVVMTDEKHRMECATKNVGIPVYTREELAMIKKNEPSAPTFRMVQKVKRTFPLARVKSSCPA